MELITVTSKIPGASLLDWLAGQDGNDKVFIKLRDHDWSVAGLGNLLTSPKAPLPFGDWTLEDFEDYVQDQDPDFKLFVAAPFYLKNEKVKFILPRFEFIQDGSDFSLLMRRWSTESPDEFQKQVNMSFLPVLRGEWTAGPAQYAPSFDQWEKTIAAAHVLEKVVLARTTDIEIHSPSLLYFLLKNIKSESYKSLFQWDDETQWMSLSPERLFRIEDDTLFTEALAGTRPRGSDKTEDENLAQELLASEKDRHEHNLVIRDIIEKLRSLRINADIRETTIQKLLRVQHLKTEIDAEMYSSVSISDLLRTLHPTAALGGTPTIRALLFLKENEIIDREYYGGAFGIMAKNFTEFFVNIRSAVTNSHRIRLFAGCGIVKDSDPQKEWDELNSKTLQYTELL